MLNEKKAGIALLVFTVIFAVFFFWGRLQGLFVSDFAQPGYYFSRHFDVGMHWVNTGNLAEIGAQEEKDANQDLLILPKNKDDRVILKVLYGIPDTDNSYNCLSLSWESGIEKSPRLKIGENKFDLSKRLAGKGNLRLALRESGGNDSRGLAIRRIEVSVLPAAGFLPDLALIFSAVIFPLMLFYTLRILGMPGIGLRVIYSLLGMASFYLVVSSNYQLAQDMHIPLILFLSLIYSLAALKKKETGYAGLFLFLALLVIGISLRWNELERVAFATMHPDVFHESGIGYYHTAKDMRLFDAKHGFYAARDWHEPLQSLLGKVFFIIFGVSGLHFRFVSFFFSVISIVLVYLAASRFFANKAPALLSCALIVFNQYLIEQAPLGLRLETEICLLLLLFYFSYLQRDTLRKWQWVCVSGILGGLWLLAKSYNIGAILFIYAISAFTNKRWLAAERLMLFGIASLISLALFLPYRFNVYRMQGSGLNDASCYARDFANAEFKGRAGFPRAKVTLKEYYFKMHKPADLVLYQVAGVAGIFYFLSEQIFNVIQEQNHLAKAFMKEKINGLRRYPLLSFKVVSLSLFMLFCIVSCLFNGKFRIILYIIVLSNLPNLFLYGATLIKAHAVIQAQRTIAQALPFVAFLISGFIYSVFNKHSLFKKNAGI